ncbi:NPCBM/NEW2 domain-containing protein [Anatilimnocola floriformis]|uniref:NPCBM/NEW2 domain-containing protein n=1 Tax=Anatilimnocola floriformis TaxID=2948575 RepID=UPI0020C353D9|nr:NPCBM/NEW2 domain-containing protein [Anatilimnocola floriformis]
MTRLLFLSVCLACAQLAVAQDADKLNAEVAAARSSLPEHPKFKKYYDFLATNPESLPVNGPKLAAVLAAEAKSSAAIREHAPSLLATWQEVVRLATAGNDYKTALPAIDELQNHPSALLTPAAARLAKGKLLTAVAEANGAKLTAAERDALFALVRALQKDALTANDLEGLPLLLESDAKLCRSVAESTSSIQFLLPLAEQAIDGDRAAAGKLVLNHLDALVVKTPTVKSRKDLVEAIATARERLTLAEGALQAQQTLAKQPLDPAANQAYGMYLLSRGNWRESLTYVALGSDAEWKKLAAESLEAKTAAERVGLADRWSALGKEKNAPSKELARHLYREALADTSLVGIARAAAEEKAKALGETKVTAPPLGSDVTARKPLPLNQWTELLPSVDLDQELVRGFFAKGPRNSISMDSSPWSRIRFPVLLTDCSYDLAVELTTGAEGRDLNLLFPVGKKNVTLIVDGFAKSDVCFFAGLQQRGTVTKKLLKPKQAYRYEVSVRLKDDRVAVKFLLNGATILDHEGPLSAVGDFKDYYLGTDAQPGFAGSDSSATITSCQLRPVSGTAELGRDAPILKPIPASVMRLKATSLTTLKSLSGSSIRPLLVNQLGGANMEKWPLVGGAQCREFLYAHAPSEITFAIPPKTKYFTAVAYCVYSNHVKFIVKVDGREMFSSRERPISPVLVEISEGAKELKLICDSLGDPDTDHSIWCYPAFRQ